MFEGSIGLFVVEGMTKRRDRSVGGLAVGVTVVDESMGTGARLGIIALWHVR